MFARVWGTARLELWIPCQARLPFPCVLRAMSTPLCPLRAHPFWCYPLQPSLTLALPPCCLFFSSCSRNKKHLFSYSEWNFFYAFPRPFISMPVSQCLFCSPQGLGRAFFPFRSLNILYSFFVLSACISSLKVLTSHFVTVFLDPVFFQLWSFLFYPQISEQCLIASLTSLYHLNFSFTVKLSSMIL